MPEMTPVTLSLVIVAAFIHATWNILLHSNCPKRHRCPLHRPKRTSTLDHRDIERMHVGPRTGFPHDRSGAADMIRVAASENQVLELVWRMAKPADRPEDHCLLAREPGVDQRQPVVALDQEG